jgi:hypothetical protein
MPTTLERMLQQAAVDPDFRSESARFGVEQLPEPVQEQHQQFFASLNDGTQGGEGMQMRSSTCNLGPFTIICDGGIFETWGK